MTQEIIALLPSADLQAKIRETNHQFTENELLQILYKYAPTFHEKLDLLQRFSEVSAPEVSALAKIYLEYENEKLNRFTEASADFVYELCIKETPDAPEEKYLCATYADALSCIDRMYEKYTFCHETEATRYTVTKRKIFSGNDEINDDVYAACELGPRKTLLTVSQYTDSLDCDLDVLCDECTELCRCRCDEVRYPCFAHEYAIIKYLDYYGKERLGINFCLGDCCQGLESEYYVIPLHSTTIRERDYEGFLDHEHIDLPLATLGSIEDLDDRTRKDYFDFVSYWRAEQS
jgi:hypothetical protein